VGAVRALEVVKPTVRADALAEAVSRMGQGLYAPPSVAGWDGGPAWANSTTMLARTNLALALLASDDPSFGKRLDPASLASQHGFTGGHDSARFFTDLLVQDAFDPPVRERIAAAKDAREAATLVLSSPEYQLA